MAVLSVQICVGLKVLKNWGLHPVDELAALADVLQQFALQQMDGCSSFTFPEDLRGQPFECFVGSTTSGPFQTTFLSAKVGDLLSYGKYFKFVITKDPEPEMTTAARDAFQVSPGERARERERERAWGGGGGEGDRDWVFFSAQ